MICDYWESYQKQYHSFSTPGDQSISFLLGAPLMLVVVSCDINFVVDSIVNQLAYHSMITNCILCKRLFCHELQLELRRLKAQIAELEYFGKAIRKMMIDTIGVQTTSSCSC